MGYVQTFVAAVNLPECCIKELLYKMGSYEIYGGNALDGMYIECDSHVGVVVTQPPTDPTLFMEAVIATLNQNWSYRRVSSFIPPHEIYVAFPADDPLYQECQRYAFDLGHGVALYTHPGEHDHECWSDNDEDDDGLLDVTVIAPEWDSAELSNEVDDEGDDD